MSYNTRDWRGRYKKTSPDLEKRIDLTISERLYDRIKHISHYRKVTMSQFLRGVLKDYIEKEQQRNASLLIYMSNPENVDLKRWDSK